MSFSNYNTYNQFKMFQEKINGVYVCRNGDSMTGNLNMNCNEITHLNNLRFCDNTYIGIGNSFDISSDQIIEINTPQYVNIIPSTSATSPNTPYGLTLINTEQKIYPTLTNYSVYMGYYTDIELGTSQTLNSGIKFIYGNYYNYTKSSGSTTNIDGLHFTGTQQNFDWTDQNTLRQYLGIIDRFNYRGCDENGETTSAINVNNLILDALQSKTQTISNISSPTVLCRANAQNITYNITTGRGYSTQIRFLGNNSNVTANITEYSFYENSSFWGSNWGGSGSSVNITNLYGLNLRPPNSQTNLNITNNWGIYQSWNAQKNYFAGDVGIGTTTPTQALDVNGNVNISGALTKGSGTFKIDHPLKPDTHYLVHSFIEGPRTDLIYRGKAQLHNGMAYVNIDIVSKMSEGTFEALCRNIQCFTTNESDWSAVRGKVSGNILTIECQDKNSNSVISWMVIGERKDKHILEANWTDENGNVIVEPVK